MNPTRTIRLRLFLILAAVALFGGVAWLSARRADRDLRANLLQQTKTVAKAVNVERVKALSGTATDIDSPDYLGLKEQLAAVREASPQCRFVYLMGRKADQPAAGLPERGNASTARAGGAVFIFVDSEPIASMDYSPPGQIYAEVPEGYRRVFDTKAAAVAGPVSDRWGTWVSALVPLTNPQTGSVIAVLGMDVYARTWIWDVAAKAALPAGIMLLLLIAVAIAFFHSVRPGGRPSDGTGRRANASAGSKPVRQRLLPHLALVSLVMLVALIGGGWVYRVQEQAFRKEVEKQLASIVRMKVDAIAAWRENLKKDAGLLAKSLILTRGAARFMADPNVASAEELREYLRLFQKANNCDEIMLLDTKGHVLLNLPENSVLHMADTDALAAALRDNKPVFIDLHTGKIDTRPQLGVVVPIFSGVGQDRTPLGTVILSHNACKTLYPLIQFWPTPSETAETQLVRRDGDQVLFLNDIRHQPGTALKVRIPLTRKESPAVKAVLGRKGVMQGRDYRGHPVVSILQPIPDTPWFMVAKIDVAEVFADWRLRAGLILALLISVVAMAGALGLVLWQRGAKAQYRALCLSAEALRESEQLLSATLRSIGDGVITCDAGGNVVRLNAVAETLTGWSTGEACGRPIAESFRIVHAQTRQAAEIPVVRALRENRIIGLANHTVLIARDGVEHQIADSCAPIHDTGDAIIGAVLIFRDVSEEYRRREQLRASESLYRSILNASPDDITITDLDGRIRMLSPMALTMFGYKREDELLGRAISDFIVSEDRECAVSNIAGMFQGDMQKPVECRGRCADGSSFDVEVNADFIRAADGQSTGMVFVVRDITERKRTQEHVRTLLAESEQARRDLLSIIEDEVQSKANLKRLAMAIDQAAEIVVVTDAQGLIQYVNPAFENVTGYTREEVVGQNPRILKGGQHDAAFYLGMWETISGGNTWKGRFVNRKKNGALYTEEVAISPVRDVAGGIANYVAVKRDITEDLNLQSQLIQAQKMEFVGRLAGGVAHDFNNILQVILGNTQLAIEQAGPDDPIRADLDDIQIAAKRASALTGQLLAFASKQVITPQTLDLNEVVKDVLTMLRRLIGENIELVWVPNTGLWPIKMDRSQVDQILANLCVNARDAIEGVGTVHITMENAHVDELNALRYEGFPAGDYVLFMVSDTGHGMDDVVRSRIFEPFFTTKTVGKGSGLGLATVYGIVRQNHGHIGVYSELGKGTTFRIYLPRYLGSDAVQPVEGPVKPMPHGSETVLLVEDDTTILNMVVRMLRGWGYTVLAAATPEAALRMADEQSGKIQLLVTDVIMPGMNGREMAGRLKAKWPDLKCLFMSGFTADVISSNGVLAEGVQFIQKPFTLVNIAVKMREALG